MVIDTGAMVTIVRRGVVAAEKNQASPKIILQTVTGEEFPVLGQAEVRVELEGGEARTHRVPVANIHDKCILGMDFLAAANCQIDAGAGKVTMKTDVQ